MRFESRANAGKIGRKSLRFHKKGGKSEIVTECIGHGFDRKVV